MRLIDADELKYKNIAEVNGKLTYVLTAEEIDNAPPVEPTFKPIAEVKFDKKQLQEIVDKAKAEVLASVERPQGEWEESHIFSCGKILRMGMNVIEHKCKNCGRWSIKWVGTIPDNYCSNCGAQMIKEVKKND